MLAISKDSDKMLMIFIAKLSVSYEFVTDKRLEYNVKGILNPAKAGALRFYVEFIKSNHDLLEGDIVEAGSSKAISIGHRLDAERDWI